MSSVQFLAEIEAFDPSLPGTRILRYATKGLVTGSAEVPPHTHYRARIQQPALMRRDLFSMGTTQGATRIGYGDLVLFNGDGALDELLDLAVDGRPVTIWQGSPGAAYPSGFTKVLVGTMQQLFVDFQTVTIRLRDRQQELMIPLQPTKYAGDNVLPAGLEGVAGDLLGKPKPLCYGKVLNVAAVCVNTSKLIYQVHDGAVASIDGVYDRGIRLGTHMFLGSVVTSDTDIRLSQDGAHWETAVTALFPTAGAGCRALAYGAGLWVACAGTEIKTSPDGRTWTARTSGVTTGILTLTYANARFMLGTTAGEIATSPDGITWTVVASVPAGAVTGLAYGAGVWVAVGFGGNAATSANNGVSWTARTSGFGATNILGLAFNATLVLFVAVGEAGKLTTSPDGITWTVRTSGYGAVTLQAVATGNGIFVTVGGNGTSGWWVSRSVDGITWSAFQLKAQATARGVTVVYGNGRFLGGGSVGGGESATILSTVDGVAWVNSGGALQVTGPSVLAFADGLTPGTYANATDLEDDALAPPPGSVKFYLAGGYFRLGAVPAGLITADVTEGATAADRTAAQIFKRALVRAGKSAGDYSAADITALDAANPAVLGFWTNDEMTVAQLIDQVTGSVWAWWGIDRTGVFRIQQFTVPSGTPVAAFTANHLIGQPVRIPSGDKDGGIPVWRTIVRHSRVYAPQPTDVADGVTADRRNLIARAWREAVDEDATVQTAHLLSPQTVEDSLLTSAADAQAEATRRLTIRKTRWDLLEIKVALDDDTVLVDLGSVVSLTHDRFNLSAGQLFRVIGIDASGADRVLNLTLFGAAGLPQ